MWLQESACAADEDALSPLVLQGSLTAEEEAELMNHYQYTGATTNIHPWLSSMVNYAQPVKFQGFDIAEGKTNVFCIFFLTYRHQIVLSLDIDKGCSLWR